MKTPKHALYSHFCFIQFLVERETFISSASGFFRNIASALLVQYFLLSKILRSKVPAQGIEETSSLTSMSRRKRTRTLDHSESHHVTEDVYVPPLLRPIITTCSSQVQSSNRVGDSGSGVTSDEDSCSSFSNDNSEECGTPKAKECRIPELLTCPSAPRKRRATSCHRPVPSEGFFSSPELDLLFVPLVKLQSMYK